MDSKMLRLIGLLLAAAAPGWVLAEDEQQMLRSCIVITDDVKRLACFDAYAAAAERESIGDPAVSAGGLAGTSEPGQDGPSEKATNPAGLAAVGAAVETHDDRVLADESFGLPAAPDEPDEAERVEAHVAEFMRLNRSNNIRITLDNGQVWQEIDGRPFRGNVEPGTRVTVTRRPFGGYKMSVEGRSSSIFVRRIK
jgi:hypothetical protein